MIRVWAILFAVSKVYGQGFVYTDGTHFLLDGEEYRFGGTNNYYLIYQSRFMVDDLLDSAQRNGFKVIRSWAYLDIGNQDGSNSVDPSPIKNGVYFQYWDGQGPAFNDGASGMEHLDYVLNAASQRNLKLVLTLTNNWREFGGVDQYVRWRGGSFHDDFYTDPVIIQWYKNWINHIINRRNTINGRLYRDDPTIFAWQLMNEPRCQGSGDYPSTNNCTRNLNGPFPPNPEAWKIGGWVKDVASYVKSLDPNHLVSVGDEGFFCQRGDLVDWEAERNCYFGIDNVGFHNLPEIDYMTFHLYPEHWNKDPSGWGRAWIAEHAAAAQKPWVVEEYGLANKGQRPSVIYDGWLSDVRNLGGNDMFWMLVGREDSGNPVPDYDGFAIHCPSDPPIDCEKLSEHARLISRGYKQ